MNRIALILFCLIITVAGCRKADLIESCTTPVQPSDTTFQESGVYIPNTFTPDGDGINDRWIPQGSGICTIHWRVFDKNQLIREGRNLFEGWDGTNGYNTAIMPSGVYYYHVIGTFDDGTEFEYEGPLELLL